MNIDLLKNSVDIIDVALTLGVDIREEHGKHVGRCPTGHSSKSGKSFTINNGYFKCWNCGVSGDVINLVEISKGYDFKDAINYIVDNHAPHLKEEASDIDNTKSEILDMNQKIQDLLYKIANPDDKQKGKSIIEKIDKEIRRRKFNLDVKEKYQIGYSHKDLVNYMISKSYDQGMLQQTGFVSPKFNYFTKKRLTIPIKKNDKIIGWSMRSLNKEEPKYYNIYNKHYFNQSTWWWGQDYVERKNYIIICEGVFDAITLQEFGYNAACSLGTAVDKDRLKLLKKYDEILLMFDNDEAGIKASERFFINSIGVLDHVLIKGCTLPKKENGKYYDPDECNEHNISYSISSSIPIIQFILEKTIDNHYHPEKIRVKINQLKGRLSALPEEHQNQLQNMIDLKLMSEFWGWNNLGEKIGLNKNGDKKGIAVSMHNAYLDFMRG